MSENEKQFIVELAALLKKYGLTIEQHTCCDSASYIEHWSFESETTDLDIWDTVEAIRKVEEENESTTTEEA
jgi:hypothetical protein